MGELVGLKVGDQLVSKNDTKFGQVARIHPCGKGYNISVMNNRGEYCHMNIDVSEEVIWGVFKRDEFIKRRRTKKLRKILDEY